MVTTVERRTGTGIELWRGYGQLGVLQQLGVIPQPEQAPATA